MPYFYDSNLMDQDEDGNPSQVQISGASPTSESGGNDPSSQPNAGKGVSTGSGFQNLDKYLQTNQAQQFGNQVLGKVGGEVEQAKQNQAQAAQKFGEQVQSANQLPNQEQVNQAIANPTSADKSQFQDWTKESYQGPNSLADSQSVWNQYWSGANQAEASAKQLGTEAGRFSLLDNYFSRPNYNYGEKSLDNLLVQQSGLGKETRDLQNQAAQIQSQGKQQAQQLQNQAAQRSAEVDANRSQVLKSIGLDDQGQVVLGENAGALGKQYQDVDNQLASTNAQRQADYQALLGSLQAGNLSAEQAARFGIGSNVQTYGVDPSQYLSQGAALTKDQVMSPEQRAYIQALSQLSGVDDNYASGTPTDASDAYSFKSNDFNSAVGQRAQEFPNVLGTAISQALDEVPFFQQFNWQMDPRDAGPKLLEMLQGLRGDPAAERAINKVMTAYNNYKVNPQTGQSNYLKTPNIAFSGEPTSSPYAPTTPVRVR